MKYPAVLAEDLTLAAAIKGRSLARFGDGELKLAQGRDAKSQAAHPELARALQRVLRDWTGPAMPCIPNIRSATPKAAFWTQYGAGRWTSLYRGEAIYGSAFVTRPDSAPWIDTPAYWAQVRTIWEGRDVVLVRGSTKSLVAADLAGAGSVHEIVGPRQHAWAVHGELLAEVRRAAAGRRVLLCLGATATVLAWELAQIGTHALDLGHIGMFLRKVGPEGRIVGPALTDADKHG